MVRPPLTDSVWPVMKAASSEARKTTAPARSSGSPSRPRGIACFSAAASFSFPPETSWKQRRVRRTGADDVDVDAVARDLAGERLGESDDPGLRARVNRLARRPDPTRVGGYADDLPRAPFDHRLEHGTHAGDRALEVDRQHLVPGRFLALHERLDLVPAGVVDEHVDRPQLRDHLRDAGANLRGIGDVDAGSDRTAADLARRSRSARRVDVGDRDLRTLLDEARGDRAADAAGPSGDEHDLVGKTFQCAPSSVIQTRSPLTQIS